MTKHDFLDTQQLMTAINTKLYRISAKVVNVQVSRAHAKQTSITKFFYTIKKGFMDTLGGDFSNYFKKNLGRF